MCGLVGCKLNRPLNDQDLARMRGLRDALAHRGPDGAGEYADTDRGLYLGHRRLSIIDTGSGGDQPMRVGDSVIVYNGELYNYKELKRQLDQVVFHTASDTEVLMQAWAVWGPQALDKFDGMFAFALLDEDKRLHLVTDPFGEKPLYLLHRPEGLYFCSEAGPLIESFGLSFNASESVLSDLLYLGYVRPPATGYDGLETVAQGRHLTINPDGTIERHVYYTLPSPFIGKGRVREIPERDVDRVRDLLCNALTVRLRSDVRLGLFLSGGVDSSLVAALAKRELDVRLDSFTVAFKDGSNESAEAARIAQHFSLPHTIIDSAGDESWRDTPGALADLYGVPNDNMTAMAMAQMCRAAKAHLTVALGGLGGDELFYGYNKYETLYRRRFGYRHAAFFQVFVHGPWPHKIKRMAATFSGKCDHDFLIAKTGPALPFMEELLPHSDRLLQENGRDLVFRARDFDCSLSMPQSYIPAADRGSMRAGVEVRTPFLNRALWDHVASLDQRALIAFGKKSVSRRLLSRYMPLDLLTAGKQGFVFPSARYLNQRDAMPDVPGLSVEALRRFWTHKNDKAFHQAALRLTVMERACMQAARRLAA